MAELVMKDIRLLVDGYDLSGDSNTVTVNKKADVLDVTVFGSSGRRRKAGLHDFDVNMGGFWNATTGVIGTEIGGPDPVGQSKVGSSGVIGLLPEGTGLGETAYFGKIVGSEYNQTGSIGGMLGYTVVAVGDGRMIKGKVVEFGTVTTSMTANAQDVGTGSTLVGRFYASVHILSTTDPTSHKMQLSIRGSSASNFGTQTTMLKWSRATIDGSTAPGTAKWASTRIPSSKLRYYKIVPNTSAGSTAAKFRMAVLAGVNVEE